MVRNLSGEPAWNGRSGASRLGCLLVLLAVVLVAYEGMDVVESEVDYRAVREEVRRQVRLAAELTDEEIRDAVLEKVHGAELPPQAENIQITRLPGNEIVVSLRYTDALDFLGGRWTWTRPRRIHVRERF